MTAPNVSNHIQTFFNTESATEARKEAVSNLTSIFKNIVSGDKIQLSRKLERQINSVSNDGTKEKLQALKNVIDQTLHTEGSGSAEHVHADSNLLAVVNAETDKLIWEKNKTALFEQLKKMVKEQGIIKGCKAFDTEWKKLGITDPHVRNQIRTEILNELKKIDPLARFQKDPSKTGALEHDDYNESRVAGFHHQDQPIFGCFSNFFVTESPIAVNIYGMDFTFKTGEPVIQVGKFAANALGGDHLMHVANDPKGEASKLAKAYLRDLEGLDIEPDKKSAVKALLVKISENPKDLNLIKELQENHHSVMEALHKQMRLQDAEFVRVASEDGSPGLGKAAAWGFPPVSGKSAEILSKASGEEINEIKNWAKQFNEYKKSKEFKQQVEQQKQSAEYQDKIAKDPSSKDKLDKEIEAQVIKAFIDKTKENYKNSPIVNLDAKEIEKILKLKPDEISFIVKRYAEQGKDWWRNIAPLDAAEVKRWDEEKWGVFSDFIREKSSDTTTATAMRYIFERDLEPVEDTRYIFSRIQAFNEAGEPVYSEYKQTKLGYEDVDWGNHGKNYSMLGKLIALETARRHLGGLSFMGD